MKRKERLVGIANEFSASMGFRQTPVLGKNMVNKMGLAGVAGLLTVNPSEDRGTRSSTSSKRGARTKPKRKWN